MQRIQRDYGFYRAAALQTLTAGLPQGRAGRVYRNYVEVCERTVTTCLKSSVITKIFLRFILTRMPRAPYNCEIIYIEISSNKPLED